MSDERNSLAPRTVATVRRSGWPGWIWAVPIAALIVVAWLGFRALMSGGTVVTIRFDDANGLKPGESNVVYRGLVVGSVDAVDLTKDGRAVEVKATIQDDATHFLQTGTRFWLRGAEPSLGNPSSLKSILAGPAIVMDPGAGEKTTHFTGRVGKPIAPAGEANPQRYRIEFDGAVGALEKGDPVKLRGFTVGEVESIALHVDPQSGAVSTPVIVDVFPSLFHVDDAPERTSRASLDTTVPALVHAGLHAKLEQDPPLIGGYAVSLEMMPGNPTENPTTVNGVPELPAVPGGGVDSIVARVNDVPIERIGQNALAITEHVKSLVSSKELDDSIDELHAALKQVRETAATAGPEITRIAGQLRSTADKLDRTIGSANTLMGGPTSQTGLHDAIGQVTYAARSIRQLADYLDEHPEALVRGRGGRE